MPPKVLNRISQQPVGFGIVKIIVVIGALTMIAMVVVAISNPAILSFVSGEPPVVVRGQSMLPTYKDGEVWSYSPLHDQELPVFSFLPIALRSWLHSELYQWTDR